MRSYFGARIYRWQDGRPKDLGSVGVPVQQQGESVSFTADGRTLMYGSEGSDSEVEPVGLSDEQLPEKAAKDDPANGDGANGQGGKGGSGTDPDPSFIKGAMVLAVATALIVALRRLLRRR